MCSLSCYITYQFNLRAPICLSPPWARGGGGGGGGTGNSCLLMFVTVT